MNMNNPYQENLENVLEKYGRDITKNVKDGKVDPVIGRDDKILVILLISSSLPITGSTFPSLTFLVISRPYFSNTFSKFSW